MSDDVVDSDDGERWGDRIPVETEFSQEVTSPVTAVIEAITSVYEPDTVDMSKPIGTTPHESVETDALNRLLTDGGVNDLSVSFLVNEYCVWIGRTTAVIADRATEPTVSAETDP